MAAQTEERTAARFVYADELAAPLAVGTRVEVSTRPARRGPTGRDMYSLWGFGPDEWREGVVSDARENGYSVQLSSESAHWSFAPHEVRVPDNPEREPEEGERWIVRELEGYKLEQYRPFECRGFGRYADGTSGWGCKCESHGRPPCGGTTVLYAGTVERLVYWADNSREAFVQCDDGRQRIVRLAHPSGDVCF